MKNASERSGKLIEQLKERGICNRRVLAAVAATPREAFIDPGQQDAAYLDVALPIPCGQTISQPFIVAYMTEKLDPGPGDEVLEIGTGSGYQAAILARLCRHVCTIERHETLHETARERFKTLGLGNVTAVLGDGAKGWPEPRQFDRIIVTAVASSIPEALKEQLKDGGRMILPLKGRLGGQRLVLVEKTADDRVLTPLLRVRFVPLISGDQTDRFHP